MRKRKTTIPEQPRAVIEQLYTVPEVAKQLSVGRTTVYKLMNADGLPYVDLAGIRRVPALGLQAWLNERKRITLA